jgi:hypothetical protein
MLQLQALYKVVDCHYTCSWVVMEMCLTKRPVLLFWPEEMSLCRFSCLSMTAKWCALKNTASVQALWNVAQYLVSGKWWWEMYHLGYVNGSLVSDNNSWIIYCLKLFLKDDLSWKTRSCLLISSGSIQCFLNHCYHKNLNRLCFYMQSSCYKSICYQNLHS